MKRSTRSLMMTLSAVLIFAFSAISTVPVLADDTTPPPTTSPELVQPTEEVSTSDVTPIPTVDANTESTPDVNVETTPVAIQPVEAGQAEELPEAPDLISQIPDGTDIVALDENGNTLPLATQEAAQVISEGDPQWCPAGVTPGSASCTPSRSTFSDMLIDLANINGGHGPNSAGVIWIHKDYNSSSATSNIVPPNPLYPGVDDVGVTSFTLDGSLLTNMAKFSLTIQGGWVSGKTIDVNTPSTFDGASLNILNWGNAVTINDIIIQGNTTDAQSLQVTTTGIITTNRVKVRNNSVDGANLDNHTGTGTAAVNVNNSSFTGNSGHGLIIKSAGKITLLNVVADNNGLNGAWLDNIASPTKQGITILGLSEFNGNSQTGLYAESSGLVTLTDITANNNTVDGAYLRNQYNENTFGVLFVGTNVFNDNTEWGLDLITNGALTIKNLYANSNGVLGASLNNSASPTMQPISITSSQFKFNAGGDGLQVTSSGLVTITNVTADSNGGAGLSVNNTTGTMGVTLTATVLNAYTFNGNGLEGVNIQSHGMITLNNVTANNNGLLSTTVFGVSIDNSSAATPQNVTLTGTNNFDNNHVGGLYVHTHGIILLNNIHASGNGNGYASGSGVVLSNEDVSLLAPKAVTLAGTNVMSNNKSSGLTIDSIGLITLSNLTASGNGVDLSDSVILNNSGAGVAAGVTLNGLNFINDNYKSGLSISSKGLIKINSLTANGNGNGPLNINPGYGVDLNNTFSTTFAGVTFTGTNSFIGNHDAGLRIQTNGPVALASVVAKSTTNGDGVNINNQSSSTLNSPQNVTISGTNIFSTNSGSGLYVSSYGIITISNVTAAENGSGGTEYGIFLDNHDAAIIKPVTLSGVNNVTDTDGVAGIYILSKGIITLSSATASGTSNGDGAYLYNAYSGLKNGVSLIGFGKFSDNAHIGLNITSLGSITVNNITANSNGFQGANIDNDNVGSVGSVVVAGTSTFNTNTMDGLDIVTLGTITISNVTASFNSAGGATLINKDALLAKNVILTGTNVFNGNDTHGLSVQTKGAITSSLSLTANDTANDTGNFDSGIYLNNTFGGSGSKQAITLSGKTIVTGNYGHGLYITSYGIITVNGLNATGNAVSGGSGYYGASLTNNGADTALGIVLGGTNIVSGNSLDGLYVSTKGTIKINSLTASGNVTGLGASLNNTTGSVTFTGVNNFNGNYLGGLDIQTAGAVSLNSITASDTTSGVGLLIDNTASGLLTPQNITFTGVSTFSNNYDNGAVIDSFGIVTFNGITANSNGLGLGAGYGVIVTNSSGTLARNVVLNGTNTFNGNYSGGLSVSSLGSIVVNNLTASGSTAGYGASLRNDNATSVGVVTLTGTNKFENNYINGAQIYSFGAITLSNVTASGNGNAVGYGLYIDNHASTTVQKVTLTGVNTFSDNTQAGMFVNSKGLVTLSNVTASGNGTDGVSIDNDEVGASGGVTLTGSNAFMNNSTSGLRIVSQGAVSITKIVSNSNGVDGLSVTTTANVTLTCGNFVKNTQKGWSISTPSLTTLIAVVSSGNGTNTSLTGGGTLVTVRNCPLP